MNTVRPVHKTSHASARWKPFKKFDFAAGDAFAALVSSEVRRAALYMPVAFFRHENVLIPVAMQGFKPGENLLVAPDGRWMAPYIPAVYRGYPFSVRQNPEGKSFFCVDEGSGLVTGIGADAESDETIDNDEQPFFDSTGEMTEPLAKVLEFAKAIANDRAFTKTACEEISRSDILVPWSIPFEDNGKNRTSGGLLRVDEARLNDLDADRLLTLQRCGALNLLFCQMISVSQVGVLQRLNKLQGQRFDPETDSLDQLLGLPDDDVIEFGF